MSLFITSDKSSRGTITVNGFSTTFSVLANQISTPISIPYNRAYVAEAESGNVVNKGIHVLVDNGQPPVVVFAHIFAGFRSEASLILPVTALGRKYFSTNFWQASTGISRSQFQIVATEPNTVVQYQLRRNGVLDAAAQTKTLVNAGDVLQIQNTQDLSGSIIESIATSTTSCKKIAVFSGSSALSISSATCTGSSYDPLYQQCYPVNTWGNNFGVLPLANNANGYHLRIMAAEDNTRVSINGSVVAVLNAGEYYPATAVRPTPFTGPRTVSSDKPISVAQYLMSSNCSGSANIPSTTQSQGDPDMIILNPVEQSIRDINIFSSDLQAIRTKFLCIYMKTAQTATFKINGAAPRATFQVMPSQPDYSYLIEDLTSYPTQSFRLTADDGFNAITYGMGDAESYGYSAGTNVIDRYQFITVNNQFASVDFAAVCSNSPFSLSMTFPYEPLQLVWSFNGLYPDVTVNSPVYDETMVVDGKTLYKYNLSGSYTAPNTPGTYPITIIAENPTTDGCSGRQEISYELDVSAPPSADFTFTTDGCVSNPVTFTDNTSNPSGRPITHRHWNFGDGNTQDDVTTTAHTYALADNYNVRYTVINNIGCRSASPDTARRTVTLNNPPTARFSATGTYCTGNSITFKDESTIGGGGAISKWTWDFGDGSPVVVTGTGADQTHTYATTGNFTVKLTVETASGCRSNEFPLPITVHPKPVVDFTLPGTVCIAENPASFTSTSTISDGSESLFTYTWDFGDASPAGSGQTASHTYTGTGPFPVKLIVKSNNGCTETSTKTLSTLYAPPVAGFNAPAEVCIGTSITFNDISTAPGSSVTQWQWNFGDLTSSTDEDPVKTYATAGAYTVTLSVTSAQGCHSVNPPVSHPVTVNPVPVADFTISTPGCEQQDVTFTSTASGGTLVKWTWDYGEGSPVTMTNGNPVVHNYATSNSYTATLQVETDKGCKSSVVPKPVTINPLPAPAFTTPVACINDQAAFAGTATIASGSVTGWEWSFGDVNANPGNPNTSGVQTPTHQFTVAGDYTVQLTAASAAGCKNAVDHTFTVNGDGLTPGFTLVNTGVLCSDKEITIRDASAIDAGKIIRVEIFWDPADLSIKTVDTDPAVGKTYTHTYPAFGSPATRTYRVQYDIYSGTNCVESHFEDITLQAIPQVVFSAVVPVCSNVATLNLAPHVTLSNALPGSGVFSGTGVSPAGVFTPATAGVGSQEITYTFTADNGCINTKQQTVVVNPTPKADAGPDKFVLEGGMATMTPVLVTGIPVSYEWSPATWLNNAFIPNAVVSPLGDQPYKLTVTSDKGCVTTDELFVKLLLDPVIPNIFSPNGDGIHDKWVIESLESYPGCVVQIYNRYGQPIYKVVNYTTPWDGRVNGKDVPVGTYYYIIDPKNGRKPITGYLDIIR
ncbi:MAG: PKD domain-containing protein [Chitinophagaceae bacterium]